MRRQIRVTVAIEPDEGWEWAMVVDADSDTWKTRLVGDAGWQSYDDAVVTQRLRDLLCDVTRGDDVFAWHVVDVREASESVCQVNLMHVSSCISCISWSFR